jgi:hypothetical protein
MQVPGFTAELSFAKPTRRYRSTGQVAPDGAIIPQAPRLVDIVGLSGGWICFGYEDDETGDSFWICNPIAA